MSFYNNVEKTLNVTTTTNGDKTYRSTLNSNLDLFSSVSSLRGASLSVIQSKVVSAFKEDPATALKILFYIRDSRGGAGERRAFRVAMNELLGYDAELVSKVLKYIPSYGRWDDLVHMINVEEGPSKVNEIVIEIIREQLNEDLVSLVSTNEKNVSLLAKWLPSVNASSKETRSLAKFIAKHLGMKLVDYRKTVVKLRKQLDLLETRMSTKDYTFAYDKLPAKALYKHTKAFERNDNTRYNEYLNSMTKDENLKKLSSKAQNLFPYEIYAKARKFDGGWSLRDNHSNDVKLADSMWDSLPKDEIKSKFVVVCDSSGSMNCPLPGSSSNSVSQVANSLAIYAAERLTGAFKNKFITFSSSPQMVTLKGKTLSQKAIEVEHASWQMNTNIKAVYDLILKASLASKPEDYIENVVIVSDMEFDGHGKPNVSTYEDIKSKFARAGIPFPQMVFWNVNVNRTVFPTTDLDGASFVSGFSSSMFKQMSEGRVPSALELMERTISKYDFVDEALA